MRLEGKVALVTGATGGLGQAIAVELALEGASVAVHYRQRRAEAEALVRQLNGLGRPAVAVTGAVENAEEMQQAVAAAVAALGRLDILVNNAGVIDLSGDPWGNYDYLMAVNVKGPLVTSQAAYPYLKAAQGVIVMLSSTAAFTGVGAYGVSKAALNAVTRSLAQEFAPAVRVVGLAPGFVAAGMNDRRRERLDEFAQRSALKRNGTPREVARAVAFLASPDAGWMTGETVALNGGSFMRP